MFTAYVLTPVSRAKLLKSIPPQYSRVVAHHVTEQFGAPADATSLAAPTTVRIRAVVDSGDGLQALVVLVDEKARRPDGNRYHITWSLDPDKYKPVDSNKLVDGVDKWTIINGLVYANVVPVTV
jgi:hypothetical protein